LADIGADAAGFVALVGFLAFGEGVVAMKVITFVGVASGPTESRYAARRKWNGINLAVLK